MKFSAARSIVISHSGTRLCRISQLRSASNSIPFLNIPEFRSVDTATLYDATHKMHTWLQVLICHPPFPVRVLPPLVVQNPHVIGIARPRPGWTRLVRSLYSPSVAGSPVNQTTISTSTKVGYNSGLCSSFKFDQNPVSQYYSVALTSLLFYDYFLTLEDEVCLYFRVSVPVDFV